MKDDVADLINRLNLDWEERLEIGITGEADYWVRLLTVTGDAHVMAEGFTLQVALERLLEKLPGRGGDNARTSK